MLTRLETAKKRWGGNNSVIDSWLNERQGLLVKYCELAALPPYEQKHRTLPAQGAIREFCQLLMDYVSTGHFEIYNDVVSKCEEHGESSLNLANSVYPKIANTTDYALAFNDKYAEQVKEGELEKFDLDLSKLGQHLEERFAHEDELIGTLSDKHSQQA